MARTKASKTNAQGTPGKKKVGTIEGPKKKISKEPGDVNPSWKGLAHRSSDRWGLNAFKNPQSTKKSELEALRKYPAFEIMHKANLPADRKDPQITESFMSIAMFHYLLLMLPMDCAKLLVHWNRSLFCILPAIILFWSLTKTLEKKRGHLGIRRSTVIYKWWSRSSRGIFMCMCATRVRRQLSAVFPSPRRNSVLMCMLLQVHGTLWGTRSLVVVEVLSLKCTLDVV